MFQAAMKYRKDAKNDQVVPQSHLVCACAKYMHKREWMFEKMKMLRTKFCGLPQVENVEEELKQMREERRRKRREQLGAPYQVGAATN
jgi:hypothetical protein